MRPEFQPRMSGQDYAYAMQWEHGVRPLVGGRVAFELQVLRGGVYKFIYKHNCRAMLRNLSKIEVRKLFCA